jgi:hypothetical protein
MRITELFQRGEFVVTAEVGPPKGFHIEPFSRRSKYIFKKQGSCGECDR